MFKETKRHNTANYFLKRPFPKRSILRCLTGIWIPLCNVKQKFMKERSCFFCFPLCFELYFSFLLSALIWFSHLTAFLVIGARRNCVRWLRQIYHLRGDHWPSEYLSLPVYFSISFFVPFFPLFLRPDFAFYLFQMQ